MPSSTDIYLDKRRAAIAAKAAMSAAIDELRDAATNIRLHWASIPWPGRPALPLSLAAKFTPQFIPQPRWPTPIEIGDKVNAYLNALKEAHNALDQVDPQNRGELLPPPD
jgi:hypothetical protein